MARTRNRLHKDPVLLPGLDAAAPASSLPWSGPCVAGVDEVGRGCLAGPVVACAVSLPEGLTIPGLNDSKKLAPAMREELAPLIREQALSWGLGVVWPARIDTINILQATFEAMTQALLALACRRRRRAEGTQPSLAGPAGLRDLPELPGLTDCAQPGRLRETLSFLPELVLVDGNKTIPPEVQARLLASLAGRNCSSREELDRCTLALIRKPLLRQHAYVKGDGLVPAISAASVLAKTWRDALMTRMDERFPGYGLAEHKGYGTKVHLEALQRLGPTPLHRLSFRGVPARNVTDKD